MKVKLLTIVVIALFAEISTAAETRCGWIENSLPGGVLSLTDKDGTWTLSGMSMEVDNGLFNIPGVDFPKGDSCGCITGETNTTKKWFTKVTGVKKKSIKVCQGDKSLK